MVQERDWGLHTLDTTRDMDKSEETWGWLAGPLVYTTFGNLLRHIYNIYNISRIYKYIISTISTIFQVTTSCTTSSPP